MLRATVLCKLLDFHTKKYPTYRGNTECTICLDPLIDFWYDIDLIKTDEETHRSSAKDKSNKSGEKTLERKKISLAALLELLQSDETPDEYFENIITMNQETGEEHKQQIKKEDRKQLQSFFEDLEPDVAALFTKDLWLYDIYDISLETDKKIRQKINLEEVLKLLQSDDEYFENIETMDQETGNIEKKEIKKEDKEQLQSFFEGLKTDVVALFMKDKEGTRGIQIEKQKRKVVKVCKGGHEFHCDCIRRWSYQGGENCPICRRDLIEKLWLC